MSKIIKRNRYLTKIAKYYNKPLIKVITWMRRCWKSCFLKSIFDDLIEKELYLDNEIFYINKELLKFDFISDYRELNNYFLDWKKENNITNKFVIAIDEIQFIDWWEKFINSILSEYEEKVDIFITWSNSNLLSSELSTYISWRYIEFHIYPLSFNEYKLFSIKKSDKNLFLDYIKYWGLPWIFNLNWEEEVINDYLKWVYNTIFVKDILNFNKIKNSAFFERLYFYLFKNISVLFSAKKIKDYIYSQKITTSVDTIINYINLWLKTYLIYETNRFDIKWKKIFQVNNKYYAWDIWLRNALVWFSFKDDIWNILENIVYLELKARWYDVQVWVLWDKEIDFIATKNGNIKYFQVTYLLSSEKVREREFWNLLQINDNWDKYVLSMDEVFETRNDWVIHKNIIEWLLEK